MRKRANVLILDLDNTLFDWFEMWSATFTPLYEDMKRNLPIDEKQLQSEIRAIHQAKRTSEYTFLLDDLPSAITKYGRDGVRLAFSGAIAASKQGRDRSLRLYPEVFQTLWELKNAGTLIVAYTESHSFYSGYRLKRFGLDGVVSFLYSPEDHDLPEGVSLEKIRNSPDEFYELQVTKVRHTPRGEIKPNRKVLVDILKDIGASAQDCVYVGDSLFKDVAMAQDVGVNDVFAEYGLSQGKPEYELLRKVSHWTDDDVERERAVSKREIKPSVSIRSFGELTSHFEFVGFKAKSLDDEKLKIVVDVWKKCVDVQQHFNDIEMRIRNFAISVAGALVAAAGFSYQQNIHISIASQNVNSSLIIVFFALLALGGFYFMDRFWYHKLLKASVDHAGAIEKRYKNLLPELSLGQEISASSPITIFGKKIGSNEKITIFYSIGALGLLALGAAFFFVGPLQKNDKSMQSIPIVRNEPPPVSQPK